MYENEINFTKTKRIFESHSAILPTYLIPKALTPDEEMVVSFSDNALEVIPVKSRLTSENCAISSSHKDK